MDTDTVTTPMPKPGPGQTAEQAGRLRRIAEQQGTLGKSTFENLLGTGTHLWESDAEFEQFLQLVRASRGKE